MFNHVEYVSPLKGSKRPLLITLLSFQCADMPLPAEGNVEHKSIIKRCMSSQSLGMFRLQTEAFLLCYDSECLVDSLQLPPV